MKADLAFPDFRAGDNVGANICSLELMIVVSLCFVVTHGTKKDEKNPGTLSIKELCYRS